MQIKQNNLTFSKKKCKRNESHFQRSADKKIPTIIWILTVWDFYTLLLPLWLRICWLYLLKRGKTPPTKKVFWVWYETNSDVEASFGALRNVEYAFIAITPRSTLSQISSTC